MFIDFIERKWEERERKINWLPPIHSPSGDATHKVGMCPDWESIPQPFGVWVDTPNN